MRIAFLGPCHPFRGGIAHFAEQLAKEFLSKDIEIRMFNFIHQYPALIFPASGQYATTQEDLPFPQERVLTPYNPLTWKFTCKRIDRFAPNILILSYWLPIFAPVYLWILAHLRHTKVFLLAHNLDFHERWPLADCLSKKLIHKVDKVIVLSAKSAGDLLTLNPESGQSKLIRGFHPIFTDYQNIGRTHEREEFTLLFFGLVKEYKGLDILLKALPMVKNVLPKIKLIIAGDVYGKKDQYQQIISEHNLEEHLEIHFRYIENDEVPGFFERAEVCVLPYR
ncbi:MAG: glycosyltransferase, partial [Candidatus Cloacimonetes bacterium]|nr:glycosyltransferase [Candidatus Cloacimonadota bacterium]